MSFGIDPHLEDKSLLVFEFKNTHKEGVFTRILNFLENITVAESLETNYSEYTPIGSNGSVFAYLGAKSRKLELSFNLTLPNIQEHTIVKATALEVQDRVGIKSSYFRTENFGDFYKKDSYANLIGKFDTAFYHSMDDNEKKIFEKRHARLSGAIVKPTEISKNPSFAAGTIKPAQRTLANQISETARVKSIFQVMYWVNLIRSCVLTSSKRPYLGPPIITLTHGIMFMSVPCICQSYSINVDGEAGYDPTTLLPRRLKITMSLREVRLRGGDFSPEEGRLMPGWDSLYDEDRDIGYPTMDPQGVITL